MIHIVFKENGAAVQTAEQAEKIAKALLDANYQGEILSYVEFPNPQAMLAFFKLLKLMELVGDPEKFEENLNNLRRELDQLKDMLNKEASKQVTIQIDADIVTVSLGTLISTGIYTTDGKHVKLDIDGEKIKLLVKTR